MKSRAMRTTIEIRDEDRARLLEIAARRGEKGFSAIVAEALELYLSAEERREAARRKALTLRGSVSDEDAEALELRTREIRGSWR